MKKSLYFRACRNKQGFTFQADYGYILTFYNGSRSIDLAIGKNHYDLWTITDLETGFSAHYRTFPTRKEAIAAITAEHLQKIFDFLDKWQFYDEAVQRLQEHHAKYQV